MSIVKRQHWIPRMMIKEWIDSENELKYFSKESSEHKVSNYNDKSNKFSNDPFIKIKMYEREGVDLNYTEKNLSWIENEFEIVKTKIKKQRRNNHIKINRRDLEIIKTFITTMSSRTMSILKRYENADGDFLFKAKVRDLTPEERKEILFGRVDKTIELQMEKFKNDYKGPSDKIDNLKREIFEDGFGGFMNDVSMTALKFFKSNGTNFILTDQYGTNIVNPVPPGGFLLGIYPITPEICVGLLYENEMVRMARKMGADLMMQGKLFTSKYFGINFDKWFTFDGIPTPKSIHGPTYEDSYKYPLNPLSKEEVGIFNAYLETQSSDLIVYHDKKDYENTINVRDKFKIYRGEDEYRN